ncbi:hypothetical protein R1flu_009611 [Riccia fluitans]|uniref:Uncharacterized protein n=1 Tax=Riccia fluitans TaxID=41844 RepID=A0ABD1Z3P2_9MARC
MRANRNVMADELAEFSYIRSSKLAFDSTLMARLLRLSNHAIMGVRVLFEQGTATAVVAWIEFLRRDSE